MGVRLHSLFSASERRGANGMKVKESRRKQGDGKGRKKGKRNRKRRKNTRYILPV